MMDGALIAGLVSACASVIGTFGGILVSSKLTNYRLQQLEERVNKHNNLIERMYKVEDSAKSAHHRIDELREEMRDV